MTATPPPIILIVDDTPSNVLLLERLLAEKGYQPRPVTSGRMALAVARAEPPDLILLDITMPGMNGYEVCGRLKADPALKEIPVIFISALHETIDKVRAFQVGGVDYVTKPFEFEEVLARVKTHLSLRRLEKMRMDLTHMVIHDLSNPLSVIFFFLDVLDLHELPNLSSASQKFVTLARLSAEELRNMILSMLYVSKMEAAEMTLQRKPCDLGALIEGVRDGALALSGDRRITYDTRGSRLVISIDSALIRRVFQNLLSNALRFTSPGGEVRIVVTPAPGAVRIAVIDAGPGIAPEDHFHIFDKFGQVETMHARTGTGLGLTYCKLAVEAHGGQIGVESETGKGSTFWLELPRQPEGTLTPARQKS